MDGFLEERVPDQEEPGEERVESRERELRRAYPEAEDPKGAAEQGLKESDARTASDPAPRDLDEERVERRKSEDTTPPPDMAEGSDPDMTR